MAGRIPRHLKVFIPKSSLAGAIAQNQFAGD
jgi:hypothetical protein